MGIVFQICNIWHARPDWGVHLVCIRSHYNWSTGIIICDNCSVYNWHSKEYQPSYIYVKHAICLQYLVQDKVAFYCCFKQGNFYYIFSLCNSVKNPLREEKSSDKQIVQNTSNAATALAIDDVVSTLKIFLKLKSFPFWQ